MRLEVRFGAPKLSVSSTPEPLAASTGTPVVRDYVQGGLPVGGQAGDILVKRSSENDDAYWVAPANAVEQDNTLPITSAAVYTEVGNIDALLATI